MGCCKIGTSGWNFNRSVRTFTCAGWRNAAWDDGSGDSQLCLCIEQVSEKGIQNSLYADTASERKWNSQFPQTTRSHCHFVWIGKIGYSRWMVLLSCRSSYFSKWKVQVLRPLLMYCGHTNGYIWNRPKRFWILGCQKSLASCVSNKNDDWCDTHRFREAALECRFWRSQDKAKWSGTVSSSKQQYNLFWWDTVCSSIQIYVRKSCGCESRSFQSAKAFTKQQDGL